MFPGGLKEHQMFLSRSVTFLCIYLVFTSKFLLGIISIWYFLTILAYNYDAMFKVPEHIFNGIWEMFYLCPVVSRNIVP